MPQAQVNNFVNDPARLRGLPLCFYGCPKTATMKPRSVDTPASRCANYDASATGSSASEFPSGSGGGSNAISDAICASLQSVQNILSESKVVEQKLAFPGQENFASSSSSTTSYENSAEHFHVENSALTSQSVRLFYGSHSLLLHFSCLLYIILS